MKHTIQKFALGLVQPQKDQDLVSIARSVHVTKKQQQQTNYNSSNNNYETKLSIKIKSSARLTGHYDS